MLSARKAFIAIVISSLGLANNAAAGVVSRDFQSVGDSLLTYDAVNQREWLDIMSTYGVSAESLHGMLEVGGALNGFKIGSYEDVRLLLVAAGFDSSTIPGNQNYDDAVEFVGIVSGLEATGGILHKLIYTSGRIQISAEHADIASVTVYAFGEPVIPGALNPPLYPSFGAGINNFSSTLPELGYWLYRDAAVPEPATSGLMAICISLCAARLRSKR